MKKPAVTLLEVVVYLGLAVIMVGVLGRIVLQVHRYSAWSNKKISSLLERQLFGDVVRRDVMSASWQIRYWDVSNGVFQKSFIDEDDRVVSRSVGFYVKDGRALRCEGVYDFGRRVWVQKSSSVVCSDVGWMRWKVEQKGGRVVGVRVWIKSTCGTALVHGVEEVWYVRLRNGIKNVV